jgi:energy-coupling factor transport system permease protein
VSNSFDLYVPGESWLHRLDPRAKLWAALLAGIIGLVYRQVGLLAGLLLLAHLLLLSARIPGDRIRWLWLRLAPLLIMILILQPLFAPGPDPGPGLAADLLRLGPLRVTVTGLLDGLSFALRAAALAFLAAAFLLTTGSTQLVQGLVKLGLPYPWGLTVGLAIRYLPTTYGLFTTIGEAQQARGWIVGQGSLLQRARSYLPILVATVIAALRLSDSLGLALAARGLGYTSRRTVLHDLHFGARDWAIVVLAGLLFGGLLAVRYGLGLGGQPW